MELRKLLDDVEHQLEMKSYGINELCLRFHHRLVAIHLFRNGNGRHARSMTDILLVSQGRKKFTWGASVELTSSSETRKAYIAALREADNGHYQLLLDFVR